MMVWVIWKALHPLRRLAESCAAISGCHLETVGTRAGVSLWEKEQRLKYPFLRLD